MSQQMSERHLTTERLTGQSGDIAQGLLSAREVRELIARRAYDHYTNRGEQSGDELSDWLQAEREVVEMLLSEPLALPQIEMPNGEPARDGAPTKRRTRSNGAGTRAAGWSKRKNTIKSTRA